MTDERESLLSDLRRVNDKLYKNMQMFDLAVEDSDIEALIYEHRSLTIRQSALIARIKELGIREDSLCGK
ncbi:MAG: hypothetical protein IK990_04590 [Ruminiclostridium sp.]|nr:hypothetical protein [Ruminiclostridium sp.]